MGKHGKDNMSKKEKQTERARKKENFKKNLSSLYSNQIKKQGIELPKLKSHKAAIILDMKNKKTTNSRESLINNLKNKLETEDNNINSKISMAHLLESSYHGRSLSNNYQFETLLQKVDYLNKDDEEFFNEDEEIKGNKSNVDNSKKLFMKDLKKVIESSDVVLEVLDARDPNSYRSKELESQVLSFKDEKKLILVINKIDLVSAENANAWKLYLQQEFPCVLFKANTQNQNSNLSNISIYHSSMSEQKHFIDEMIHSNKAVGGEDLMNILKNYARIEGGETKKTLVVGIVGFPNVGKSSIINSLKRGKAVGVSSVPGYTKAISEIILDKNIKLLDCPGVVYSSSNKSGSQLNQLSNVLRPEQIDDPVNIVFTILKKVSLEEIFNTYNIYELEKDHISKNIINEILSSTYQLNSNNPMSNLISLDKVEKLLCLLAIRFNKYKQGGVLDLSQAALIIIKDWNDGKIKYMTPVPNNGKNMCLDC